LLPTRTPRLRPTVHPFGHLADIEALPGKLRAALGGSNLLAQT
jgi:hypothetical protein